MSKLKQLIVFDPAHYEPGATCIPLLVPKELDLKTEYKRMLSQFPPNQCRETFDHWLRHQCHATDATIDVFDVDLGDIRT